MHELAPDSEAPPYRREFTARGRDFSVAVQSRVLTTDADEDLTGADHEGGSAMDMTNGRA